MKLGFSLTPGGLLFPYHIGVLSSLTKRGYVTDTTPLAGSSAGAIAVACRAASVSPEIALNGCIRISEKCAARGGARGNLLPLLEEQLEDLLPMDAHEVVNRREGFTGLAYREIFPVSRSVLQDEFGTREELIEAVCNSSMFPFFTSNLPFVVRKPRPYNNLGMRDGRGGTTKDEEPRLDVSSFASQLKLPRLVVDGFFAVDRKRFGCPIFPESCGVEREITVSVFPHSMIGFEDSEERNRIAPSVEDGEDSVRLFEKLLRGATQASTAQEHMDMYERGFRDASKWAEEDRGSVLLD